MALIWLKRIYRTAYGGFFAFYGVLIWIEFLFGIGQRPTASPERAELFWRALDAAIFPGPLAGAAFVAGGISLFTDRTAPLGVIILWPVVAFIFFYHLTLTGMVAWGTAWLIGLIGLTWLYRDAFRPLVGLNR